MLGEQRSLGMLGLYSSIGGLYCIYQVYLYRETCSPKPKDIQITKTLHVWHFILLEKGLI